jgi:dihydroorotate dehydrogenase (NAD+) catalytic subunit
MAKHDLNINPPIMNSAGALGFFPDLHGTTDWSQLGAFITNPISPAGRSPAHGNRILSYPGGFLLHTGYPNPGFHQSLRRCARHWSRSPLPVIIHLLCQTPEQAAKMVRQLESIEGISGVELGVDGDASLDLLVALTQAATGELTVIMRLPFERALELSPAAIRAGAMAVSLAPPRGMLPTPRGEQVKGRLYGPAIFPAALKAVDELVRLGIPTIGAGGIYSYAQCSAMLSAGAQAVQLDAVLWRAAGNWKLP